MSSCLAIKFFNPYSVLYYLWLKQLKSAPHVRQSAPHVRQPHFQRKWAEQHGHVHLPRPPCPSRSVCRRSPSLPPDSRPCSEACSTAATRPSRTRLASPLPPSHSHPLTSSYPHPLTPSTPSPPPALCRESWGCTRACWHPSST